MVVGALWSEFEVSAALAKLLVELSADPAVDVVEVLVGEADLSDGAVRVQVRVIHHVGGDCASAGLLSLVLPVG